MGKWTSKLYIGGKEVKLKPGHVLVIGNESYAQLPACSDEIKLKYESGSGHSESQLRLASEYGSSMPIDFCTSEEQ